jgi:hypothetical protein
MLFEITGVGRNQHILVKKTCYMRIVSNFRADGETTSNFPRCPPSWEATPLLKEPFVTDPRKCLFIYLFIYLFICSFICLSADCVAFAPSRELGSIPSAPQGLDHVNVLLLSSLEWQLQALNGRLEDARLPDTSIQVRLKMIQNQHLTECIGELRYCSVVARPIRPLAISKCWRKRLHITLKSRHSNEMWSLQRCNPIDTCRRHDLPYGEFDGPDGTLPRQSA